jgi:hypothetical protein
LAREHRVVVKTLPPEEGLRVTVRVPEGDGTVLEGVTDASGSWSVLHDMDPDTPCALVLERDGVEVVRCNGFLSRLNPMEVLMTNPTKRTENELHRRWRKAYRDQKKRGVQSPDPESVARQAFS